MSTIQPTAVIADYLQRRVPFFDRVNARTVPAGLRVLTTSRPYCYAFLRFGIRSTQIRDRLFELRAE